MSTTYSAKYFRADEFRCKCCGCVKVADKLLIFLDTLRAVWGEPIYVNSGYRCAAHNKAVGGAANSRHMCGLAADIRPSDPAADIAIFKATIEDLAEGFELRAHGWEILTKRYPNFVHVAAPR